MSNPFAALDIYDQEDQGFAKQNKSNQVTKDKKPQKGDKQTFGSKPVQNREQNIPLRVRDDAKVIRNKRQPRPAKQIPEGHTLDRRSGTGRVDKPRKEGGGRGGIGNLKDEQNKEKYLNQEQGNQQQTEQVKPEEPQGVTLQEYYRNKGINIEQLNAKKQPVKKTEINAEWIKKQKLTVLTTKQQMKHNQRNKVQIVKRDYVHAQNDNSELLGFHSKGDKKVRQNNNNNSNNNKQHKQERHDNRDNRGGDKKFVKKQPRQKIVVNEEDFPSL